MHFAYNIKSRDIIIAKPNYKSERDNNYNPSQSQDILLSHRFESDGTQIVFYDNYGFSSELLRIPECFITMQGNRSHTRMFISTN